MNVASIPRELKELPIGLIDEPEMPSRSSMDDTKLDELVANMRANGFTSVIVVARTGERFEVVAGHRRRIAAGRAGIVAVPCLIYPSRDDALDAIQFSENAYREDLNPADEAVWFAQKLEKQCSGDIEKLAALVGVKVSYIDNRLEFLRGYDVVFDALKAGTVGIGVAQELNKFESEKWATYYLDLAHRCGATRAVVCGWLIDHKRAFSAPQPPEAPPAASPAGMPTDAHNPFTCVICRKADNVHLIQQLNIHQHCRLAIFDPMLAAYRGES